MRVRHKELQRDMVVHSLPQPITAYELLCAVCCKQLPEIYDGENPIDSKGCFAQAWSVGEILRVYDALRD